MSSSGVVIPPGYSPPLAVITDDDHTAWLLIATALGLTLTLLFGVIRSFIRWVVSPGVGLDDVFLIGATIVAVIQSAIVLSACSSGLGKSISLVPLAIQTKVQQLYYASTLFFVIGVGMSKLSVVCFLLRLSPVQRHRMVFYGAAGVVGVWTVASLFAMAFQCNSSHPWLIVGEQCPGMSARWRFISAFDIAIEIGLLVSAIYLVWALKTSLSKKFSVVCAFAMRLPLIIVIAFRVATFDQRGYTTNPTLLEDLFIVWTQTELNYSIMSATIPALRPVMNDLNTQFGGLGQDADGGGYGYGHANASQNYQLSNLRSANASHHSKEEYAAKQSAAVNALDGRDVAYSYDIWVRGTKGEAANQENGVQRDTKKASGDATSVDSNDSRQMIIRKDTSFQVAYETN